MKLNELLKVWCSSKHWTVEVKTDLSEILGYGYTVIYDSDDGKLEDLVSYKDYRVLSILDNELIVIYGGRML